MAVYSTQRFLSLVLLTALVPGGIVYSAWASTAHYYPFCDNITSGGLLVPTSVENLTRASSTIVMGEIVSVGPSWQASSGEVFTHITANVSEYLKNNQSSTSLRFEVSGGSIGCYSVRAEDEPGFSVHERVLIFLLFDQAGRLRVTGGTQGKYVISDGTAYWGDPSNSVSLENLIATIKQYV